MSVIFTECDFQSHDILQPFKEDMVKKYLEGIKNNEGYNISYTNDVLETNIIPRINKITNQTFNMKIDKITCYIYVQNNKQFFSRFHHHMKCMPNNLDPPLTASLYLDPPKVGGEFQFLPSTIMSESFEEDLIESTHTVEKDKLYFFPSWWMHRPLPQEDEKYRVCLSFNIYSYDRPEFLPAKVIW